VAVRPSRNFDAVVEGVAGEALQMGGAAEGLDRREEDVGVRFPLLVGEGVVLAFADEAA
jgi:hypothetical protein